MRTYELCVKSLRRKLQDIADIPDGIDALGYKDLLRVAMARGLIGGSVPWFGFREPRNTTSHASDPAKAAQVYTGIPAFPHEAQALRAKLTP